MGEFIPLVIPSNFPQTISFQFRKLGEFSEKEGWHNVGIVGDLRFFIAIAHLRYGEHSDLWFY